MLGGVTNKTNKDLCLYPMVLFGRLAAGKGGAGPTRRKALGDITNSRAGTGLGEPAGKEAPASIKPLKAALVKTVAATLPPVSAHASCTNAKTRTATIPAEYLKVLCSRALECSAQVLSPNLCSSIHLGFTCCTDRVHASHRTAPSRSRVNTPRECSA